MSAPEGASLIQAFKLLKEDISHYCYHEGLSVAGVCRLCLVEIKGQNKLQIACNTKVTEGMEASNQSNAVKEAVRWGLEFHLINHPLDCPICDQAGECALQDQYMKFGRYRPGFKERKVKKRKVVDLGSKIVLDTERCILCTRCVRFTDEVTKTKELGIFNRGDRSEIGVFKDKPLENDYALNTVDICPVGALTGKGFRFQQRVWYMKTARTVCSGCSTACHTFTDYNEEGLWRIRPRYNKEGNGWWMCDKGRALYKNSNRKSRLIQAQKGEGSSWSFLSSAAALKAVRSRLQRLRQEMSAESKTGGAFVSNKIQKSSDSADKEEKTLTFPAALILTGQYTNEEYKALAEAFKNRPAFHWMNNEEKMHDFDGLLLRGDRNPNTIGLKKAFPSLKPFSDFENYKDRIRFVFAAGPENPEFFPDIEEKTKAILSLKNPFVIWMAPSGNPFLPPRKGIWQIPSKTFFEKTGSAFDFKGRVWKTQAAPLQVSEALSLKEAAEALFGSPVLTSSPLHAEFKHNRFLDNKSRLW